MDAVGAQRHVVGGVGGGAAQRRFECHRPALDAGVVADLDVPARHAGVAAHGAAVLLGGFVVLEHRLDDEGREIAFFGVGAFAQPREIVLRDLDRRFGHQLLGRALDGRYGNHLGLSYSAAILSRSSVSPGRTCVNSTGASVISRPPAVSRATVKREAAKSPGSGKSDR